MPAVPAVPACSGLPTGATGTSGPTARDIPSEIRVSKAAEEYLDGKFDTIKAAARVTLLAPRWAGWVYTVVENVRWRCAPRGEAKRPLFFVLVIVVIVGPRDHTHIVTYQYIV